jgi:FemAB-related protein (PEP-CTERM system-associated)
VAGGREGAGGVTLTVREYDGSGETWDRFVEDQPSWTHFHRFGWKPVIEQTLGSEGVYLAATGEHGRLHGVLPLVRVRSMLFGHYLVSMPFLNYGGPLGTPEAVRALVEAAEARARNDRVKLLELRSRDELPIGLEVSHRKITVLLDLPAGRDALWKAFGSKLRSQIRKPEKDGVEVRFGSDQVAPFYDVFSRHMRDLGTPVLPRSWFEAIADRFGEDAWFGAAWHAGRPVAAGAGFRWGHEFEMTWASSLASHNRLAPNMLLYARFMERALEAGVSLFNFGRCTPESGTHRFKKQWGSRDEPLWWYQWSPDGASAATPSPDQGAYSLGPKVWRHLPLPIATALGPRIVRYIP